MRESGTVRTFTGVCRDGGRRAEDGDLDQSALDTFGSFDLNDSKMESQKDETKNPGFH